MAAQAHITTPPDSQAGTAWRSIMSDSDSDIATAEDPLLALERRMNAVQAIIDDGQEDAPSRPAVAHPCGNVFPNTGRNFRPFSGKNFPLCWR